MAKTQSGSYSGIICQEIILSDSLFFTQARTINDGDEDESRIKDNRFHVENNDYFGTIATIVDLMLQKKIKSEKRENKLLEKLRDDLMFLQKNHRIIKNK